MREKRRCKLQVSVAINTYLLHWSLCIYKVSPGTLIKNEKGFLLCRLVSEIPTFLNDFFMPGKGKVSYMHEPTCRDCLGDPDPATATAEAQINSQNTMPIIQMKLVVERL